MALLFNLQAIRGNRLSALLRAREETQRLSRALEAERGIAPAPRR